MRVGDGEKVVNYFGTQVIVPAWVNWLAVDHNGALYGYECKPERLEGGSLHVWHSGVGKTSYIMELILEKDWSETLVELF